MRVKKEGADRDQPPAKSSTGEGFRHSQRYGYFSKESQFSSTNRVLFQGLYTMKMVAVVLDVDRGNICYCIGRLRKQGAVALVKKGRCPITKENGVGFYTSNPDLFPFNNQLNLFGDGK